MPLGECLLEKDIEFARFEGGRLLGDLYRPATSDTPSPVFVFVHGGGWIGGSRTSGAALGRLLATEGYACFSIDYRLARKGTPSFPGAVDDVRAAVAFLAKEGGGYAINSSKIVLFGASAGGHLCALAALTEPGDSPSVRCVISAYGIYDLKAQWDHEIVVRPRANLVELFLGRAPMEDRRLYFEASPISHVTADRRRLPFFLGYGLTDEMVPCAQSEAFLLALSQAGFKARKYIAGDAGHFWLADAFDDPQSNGRRFVQLALAFASESLS